jgi:hypothetical protein
LGLQPKVKHELMLVLQIMIILGLRPDMSKLGEGSK